MSRSTFLVFRATTLTALLALLLFSLGFGGWHFYQAYFALTPAEQIQRRLKENLAGIDSYYFRLTSAPASSKREARYLVEIWSSSEDQLRVEAARLEKGAQGGLQVVVRDGSQVYYFDPSLKKFYPVRGHMPEDIPALTLEDYGRDLIEASHLKLLGREEKTRHSYYLVEMIPPEPHRYRCLDKVWLEAESLLPVRIESYDSNLCLRQVTCFEHILLNPCLEAALFEADQPAAVEQ
ncbi:MAG TPA: hypothetical protein GX693_04600 [Firmicutes bacterium]|nr:hypothetical protein [Bacillota bacterium]